MEFTASDLLNFKAQNSKAKQRNYDNELQKCLETIKNTFKTTQADHIFYKVPIVLALDPLYDYTECINFLKERLLRIEFYVRVRSSGNELYISWNAKDVEKVKKRNKKLACKNMEFEKDSFSSKLAVNSNLLPAMARLSLTTKLMKNNPTYAKLKSLN